MMMSFCNIAGLAQIDSAQYRKLPSFPRHGAVNVDGSDVARVCHISLFRISALCMSPLRMSQLRMSLFRIGPPQIGALHIATIV